MVTLEASPIRNRDAGDRRKYILALTESGRKLVGGEIEKAGAFLTERLACLGRRDLDRFTLAVNELYDITMKL